LVAAGATTLHVVNDTPALPRVKTVDEVYDLAFADGETFHAALSESLGPRGFDLMFELVAELGLLPGSIVLDVGAREAYHSIELSRRFGFTVHGIEPVRRHLDNADRVLDALAAAEPDVAARISIHEGVAQQLGEPDASIDLIWCRDVLEHVDDLETVFGEIRRVMRPAGTAVIYQMTATDWLTSAEAARLWSPAGIYAASVDPQRFEAAITASGLLIRQCIQLHGEWRERAEEDGTGLSSRQLLWVSRLLRNCPVYENRFGTDAYEAMLSDSLWGIYQMIGKLNPRIYVLSR
jgi:SAM-dependent methyltransferase